MADPANITFSFSREEVESLLEAAKAGDAAGHLPLRDNRLAVISKVETALDKVKHPDQPDPKGQGK